MIILLKIILFLIATGDILVFKFFFSDYTKTIKKEGFDELSIWRRIKFNFTAYFIMSSMVSLLIFLIYFMVMKISVS